MWYSDENKEGLVSIWDIMKFEKFFMALTQKNGHFLVF